MKKTIKISQSLNRRRLRAEQRIEKLKPLISEAHKLLKNSKTSKSKVGNKNQIK